MPSAKRKLHICVAIAVLFLLAVGVGCTGFFQNPQLVTLTVGPQSANLQQGSTIQMSAVATFDDGSTKTLTKNVFWSSSDTNVAPITQSGLLTGASPGTSTVTASSAATTGTATITVSLNNVTSIQIQPQGTQTLPVGGSTTYTCLANVAGSSQVDVTSSVTWSVTTTGGQAATGITITNQQNPATLNVTSATPGTYNVNASYVSSNQTLTNSVQLIVQ